jgi:hypothetical protein
MATHSVAHSPYHPHSHARTHTHTHAHTHTHSRARAHTHTHTHTTAMPGILWDQWHSDDAAPGFVAYDDECIQSFVYEPDYYQGQVSSSSLPRSCACLL